jgi:glycosyltransferase involved in cell wall biosynthesis
MRGLPRLTETAPAVGTGTAARRPRVSVIVPAFNGAGTIERTLESLARQSYTETEWLIVDDASHDGTARIAENFLASHPSRGRLIRHPDNWGLSRTLNHGLQESTGEAILVIHQDIVLLSEDWITRAVTELLGSPTVAVVTGDYGIPDPREVDFTSKVFGILRRQFHFGPDQGKEFVTFTEFKCDLVWAKDLREVDGFPERFRIAGEDIWVSYSLRLRGRLLLKDYALKSVQRFTGDAASLAGNLRKEFVFGRAYSGMLVRFRSLSTKGLAKTPYSRSRAWNRASQPLFLLAGLVLLLLGLVTRDWWLLYLLVALVVARLAYYGWRLFPDLRRLDRSPFLALAEATAGSGFGIWSDFAYSFGLAAGLIRWATGRTV